MTLSGGIHDMDKIISMLWDLRKIRVSLAIDDFGTSYSSLSYIRHFPIQRLKIDQSFIRSMVDDPPTEAITKTLKSLPKAWKHRNNWTAFVILNATKCRVIILQGL